MADKDFQLRIITPERVFYEGTVDMVEFNTTEGQIGVLPGHIPPVSYTHLDVYKRQTFFRDQAFPVDLKFVVHSISPLYQFDSVQSSGKGIKGSGGTV